MTGRFHPCVYFIPPIGTDATPKVTGFSYQIALLPTGVTVRDLANLEKGLQVRAQFVEADGANFVLNDPAISKSLRAKEVIVVYCQHSRDFERILHRTEGFQREGYSIAVLAYGQQEPVRPRRHRNRVAAEPRPAPLRDAEGRVIAEFSDDPLCYVLTDDKQLPGFPFLEVNELINTHPYRVCRDRRCPGRVSTIATIITIPTNNPCPPGGVLDMVCITILAGRGVLLLAKDQNACDRARAYIEEYVKVNEFEEHLRRYQEEHLWETVMIGPKNPGPGEFDA